VVGIINDEKDSPSKNRRPEEASGRRSERSAVHQKAKEINSLNGKRNKSTIKGSGTLPPEQRRSKKLLNTLQNLYSKGPPFKGSLYTRFMLFPPMDHDRRDPPQNPSLKKRPGGNPHRRKKEVRPQEKATKQESQKSCLRGGVSPASEFQSRI